MVESVPWICAAAVLVLVAGSEAFHLRRVRAVSQLTFGKSGRMSVLAIASTVLRLFAFPALVWGLLTLILLRPTAHRSELREIEPMDREHLLLLIDVSPSMKIVDAGPAGKQSRTARSRAVIDSILARMDPERLHISVVAVYNGAKPVVEETQDMEIIHNILGDLPMQYAFKSGKTQLLDGFVASEEIAKRWPANSATMILMSDGDSVPPTGMPNLPGSIGGVLVVGVGDPQTGTFINGANSRQDAATLRQIASRLGGVYHDANAKLVPTDTLKGLSSFRGSDETSEFSRRELALTIVGISTLTLALLPIFLRLYGTNFHPGPKVAAQL